MRSNADAQASTSGAGTKSAASPPTSGRQLESDATTGVPHAIDSIIGMPNVS